jgi:ATP-dependent DNA helicase RecG
MTNEVLHRLLKAFMALPAETEWLEFKEAKNNFDSDDLGQYFSALANEANLKEQDFGWLIFGVKDKPRSIVGTQYRTDKAKLDNLKLEIASHTSNGLTFYEIHELKLPEGRVLMFQIAASPKGIPVAWKGHFYGRSGESKGALNIAEIEQIRRQTFYLDWSAQVIENATIDDLEPEAILKARKEYKVKFPAKADEVNQWNDAVFLNKARVTVGGKITNTAILLLGREESTHFINPAVCRMTWIRKDNNNYLHLDSPLILNTEKLLGQISNPIYRYLPDNTLFPNEVHLYDNYVIREALHNCIAHQDYSKQERIMVMDTFEDNLLFINAGSFLPKSVEEVLEHDAPQPFYRNKFLVDAMVNLNMIDTIGSGIKRMFIEQRNRFFPLPDYDLSDENHVRVRIFGKILDKNFTKILMNNSSLSLHEVILLDNVQKNKPIEDKEAKKMKDKNLIEGRKPNYHVSSGIAALIEQRAKYIRNRGFDKEYYKKLVLEYLSIYESITREEVEDLLFEKLPDILSDEQKKSKIHNLLKELNRLNLIERDGSKKTGKWIIASK